jgi:hypothetical protein
VTEKYIDDGKNRSERAKTIETAVKSIPVNPFRAAAAPGTHSGCHEKAPLA